MLPVSRPSLGEEELEAIRRVFQSRWLGLGAVVKEFEDRIASYLGGGRQVVATNTGTTALHLALDALGIGAGDEVIVPSLTFAATVQAILQTAARPVFCEIFSADLNCDVRDVAARITPRTRAIVPVHYCGEPCEMNGILAFTGARGIRVVEDAAHAFGSSYRGRRIGSFGDITCFSFDPIKNITCGEGGAVVVEDPNLANLLRKKRMLGIDKDSWTRYQHERTWFYDVVTSGYRYHMSNINAAIGLAQLEKMDAFLARKRAIVSRYEEAFRELRGLRLLRRHPNETAPFCFIVRILDGKRDAFMRFLGERRVGTGVHYIPNHLQSYCKEFSTPLPVTERVGEEIVTLPLYVEMTEADVDQVVLAVRSFFGARD